MASWQNGGDTAYTYQYDANGNITQISQGSTIVTYSYDAANQLVRENNGFTNQTVTYEYDAWGNILNKKIYAYTTGDLTAIAPTTTDTYTYGNESWGDQLTAYNGQSIVYDEMGNPTTYLGYTMGWQGKQLISVNNGTNSITYTYNEDGLRLTKTVNGTTTSYYYNGSVLISMATGSTTQQFHYDASGNAIAVTYNGTEYYYVRNAQGDIIKRIDSTGATVVEYTYDSWGKLLSTTGSLASTLGSDQPFRYRGYVYDTETSLYYLQTRYYDPSTCRFISSDVALSTGQGVLGHNAYAYCLNNPECYADIWGNNAEAAQWWSTTMWWLCAVDSFLPIGDIVYVVGILFFGFVAVAAASDATIPQAEEENQNEPETPKVLYPGDNPQKAPDGTTWRGKDPQGSGKGNYHNPETGGSWHPDLNHPQPIGPHWDYRAPDGTWWRVFPDNFITIK